MFALDLMCGTLCSVAKSLKEIRRPRVYLLYAPMFHCVSSLMQTLSVYGVSVYSDGGSSVKSLRIKSRPLDF